MQKKLLAMLMLVMVSTQFYSSYRLTNIPPTTNSPIEEVELEENKPKIEENIPNESVKTAILSVDRVISRGGTGLNVEYNQADITLLAKLIQSEALSESYEGKVAVGSVVLNRMEQRHSTMREVIYAKSQFSGVNGRLFNQEPSEDCVKAAKEALYGAKPVGQASHFVDLTVVKPSWVNHMKFVKKIGTHWFYQSK